MGCYGIGVGRTVAAAIEQKHDDHGIIFPMAIAPFEVEILPVQTNNEVVMEFSEDLYETLSRKGVDVLIDDRNLRPGVRFKDTDLIGIPLRITIGRGFLKDGKVELKVRETGEVTEVDKETIADEILNRVRHD
jgi:prolyl-tRNA synthetase